MHEWSIKDIISIVREKKKKKTSLEVQDWKKQKIEKERGRERE